MNSTVCPERPGASNADSSFSGTIMHLAGVIETAMRTAQNLALGDARLVNQLMPSDRLPEFSGNPFERLHFKEIFEITSEIGGYSECENVARIFAGKSCCSRDHIHILVLNFGHKQTIARKVVIDLKS